MAADTEVTDVFDPAAEDESDAPLPRLTTGGDSVDQVRDYLRLIARAPLLRAEQEVDLAKRIEAGVYAQYKLLKEPPAAAALQRELELLAEDAERAKAQDRKSTRLNSSHVALSR